MYKWRHDQVFLDIGSSIRCAVKQSNDTLTPASHMKLINFVKETDPVLVSMVKPGRGILTATNDWLLPIDLETQLMFPQEIALTDLRPDLVIWARKANTVVVGELTVPWEDNIKVANEYKRDKYTDLVLECTQKGWRVILCPFEVGSHGFISNSLIQFLTKVGLSARERKETQHKASEAACRGSAWIWKKYHEAAQTSK